MNNASEPEPQGNDAIIGVALTRSLIVFAALGLCGFLIFQYLKTETNVEPDDQQPTALPQGVQPQQAEVPPLQWSEITESAGINFIHVNGATGEKLLPETMGGGCAFFDYDADGDQDILFVNSQEWPETQGADSTSESTLKLYNNDGTGKFSDVTEACGLNHAMYGMGVACADYDGDGWSDIFVSCVGRDRLFHNEQGRFVEVTESAGVAGTKHDWSSSCGWFDYDGDGDLDLFVARYLKWSREYDLSQDFKLLGGGRAYGRPQNFEGTFPALYENRGDGTFQDVAQEAGLAVLNSATNTPLGKSLGIVFEDFDSDGDLDILVANDTVRNFLFVNQSDGTFIESSTLAGVAFDRQGTARGAMGIDSAYFRNNRSIGVAIGNYANEMSALYVSRNEALQFEDEAVSNGLGPATRKQLSFGVLFLDVDLDGRLDFAQANGHLEEEIHKVQSSQTYAQSPQLFWNAGAEKKREFVACPVEKTGADFGKPIVGRGMAYADIDADGDLDLLITTIGGKPRLLRNDLDNGHHWLRLKLLGKGKNRDAIGAKVTLVAGGETQTRTVSPTRGYLSQVELPLTFGLGNIDHVDALNIRWADGTNQTVEVLDVDQFLQIPQR